MKGRLLFEVVSDKVEFTGNLSEAKLSDLLIMADMLSSTSQNIIRDVMKKVMERDKDDSTKESSNSSV